MVERSVVRKLFSFGHLLDRQGESEGDRHDDLCLSCTRHPSTLEKAVEISGIVEPSTIKEASKTEEVRKKFKLLQAVPGPDRSSPPRPSTYNI
jgi:hypothetical protein